jgi:hypothetical protein
MRLNRFAGLVLGALALAAVPSRARADESRFGGAGQLAITDDQPLGGVASTALTPVPPGSTSTASFQFATLSDNGGSGTAFAVAPAVDYFVIDHLSLGAFALAGFLSPAHGNSGSGLSETVFGIAPRVGYHVAITDTVSFWPKVYFGYVTVSASGGGVDGGDNATAVGLFAPFMFEPARHFLFGIGPNLSTQLSNNQTSGSASQSQPKSTQVGIQATIGGWCLGN